MSEIIIRKITKEEESKVRELIHEVISSLENPDFFIPYEEWEYERMFDENYAPLYGAFDKDILVAMAQLYVDQNMLKEYKEILNLKDYKVCELGGALCKKEYRHQGIMTSLMNILLQQAKENNYDYVVTMAHPENIASNNMIEKLGLNYILETNVNGGFRRKIYSLKID